MSGSPLRVAFYGRVSTEDNQDPTLSLPRQLANCEQAVERMGGQIMVRYYDVESGAGRYEARGSVIALRGFEIPIPRKGGLPELLEAARGSRFDVVVCESISRIARAPAVTFRVEEELLEAGVRLWPIDEPWEESFGSIVLRHVNVGLARGYLHELKVKSRQGIEAAARQGRHAGGTALYGYRFRELPHPNPHKARQGQKLKVLETDPVRAPIVRMIFDDYVVRGLSISEIREKLNADLDRYPPPESPDPRRRTGQWGRSSVWEILRNPKYTGYQVWNRKARKRGGKINPPEAWVWSEEPAHEALVSREMFERGILAGLSRNNASRSERPEERRRKRKYLLRSLLRCGVCGLRMHGDHRRRSTYYVCEEYRRPAGMRLREHPRTVYLREDVAVERVVEFLRTHVFGPERAELLRRELEATDPEADAGRDEIEQIRDLVDDVELRIRRQMDNLEREDPDGEAAEEIRTRLRELARTKARKQRELEAAERALAGRPDPGTARAFLDMLPLLEVDARMLEKQSFRQLLEALSFEARFDPVRKELAVRVVLHPDFLVPGEASAASPPLSEPLSSHDPSAQVRGPERHPLRQRPREESNLRHPV